MENISTHVCWFKRRKREERRKVEQFSPACIIHEDIRSSSILAAVRQPEPRGCKRSRSHALRVYGEIYERGRSLRELPLQVAWSGRGHFLLKDSDASHEERFLDKLAKKDYLLSFERALYKTAPFSHSNWHPLCLINDPWFVSHTNISEMLSEYND